MSIPILRAIPAICFVLSLTACDVSYRHAPPIINLTSYAAENPTSGNSGATAQQQIDSLLEQDNVTPGQIVALLLSSGKVDYSSIVEIANHFDDPYVTAEIVYGLLMKSDRVCQNYLYGIVDTRNGLKAANSALGSLPGIISGFTSSGGSLLTASQISSVRNGVSTILGDFSITEALINSALNEIRAAQRKMKQAIGIVLSSNLQANYSGVGVAPAEAIFSDVNNAYSIYTALLDIELYHQTCSVYDRIYFNNGDSNRLGSLMAYNLLTDEQKAEVNGT